MFAGASYIDVALLFGIAKESVFHIMWQVVDAINNTPTVGPFFFPQTREECTRQAKEWEVGIRVFVVNHRVWCPEFLAKGHPAFPRHFSMLRSNIKVKVLGRL